MTASLPDYFHDRIVLDEGSDCWLWIGNRNPRGWGLCRRPGLSTSAHRAVWQLLRGPIPDGMQLDHLCRVRCCVNPDHLEVVTPRTNLIRGRRGFYDRSGMTSQYLGVRRSGSGKWLASISADGVRRTLGTFETQIAAAVAYDAAVRELHGPDAETNANLGLFSDALNDAIAAGGES